MRERFLRLLSMPSVQLAEPWLEAFELSHSCIDGATFVGGSLERAQFCGALLRGVTFEGSQLSGADFSGAQLVGVKFKGVHGDRLRLDRADLINCHFESVDKKCSLRQASFRHATMVDCSFQEGTDLSESAFAAAALTRVDFLSCEAADSDFQRLRCEAGRFVKGTARQTFFTDSVFVSPTSEPLFEGIDLSGCDFGRVTIKPSAGSCPTFWETPLVDARFVGGQLDGCRFQDCGATSCSFEGAGLDGSSFLGGELVSAAFTAAHLEGTRFVRVDMSSCRFDQSVLEKVWFVGIQGIAAVFDGARLGECRLRSCEMRNASLKQCVFNSCKLAKVDLSDGVLSGVIFDGCTLRGMVLADADLTGARFADSRPTKGRRTDFSGANLSNADLSGEDLSECVFKRAVFDDAWLRRRLTTDKGERPTVVNSAVFEEARLTLCDLTGITGTAARFRGARLIDCQLWEAHFSACDFRGADLSGSSTITDDRPDAAERGKDGVFRARFTDECRFDGANLSTTSLGAVDLGGAKLPHAVATTADLRGANLAGVVADGADFRGARFSGGEDGPKAELEGLIARGASFQDATLVGCSLVKGILNNSRFDNADLTAATVTGCTFRGTSLVGVTGMDALKGVEASQTADFSYAFIQATRAPLLPTSDKEHAAGSWRQFKEWINKGAEDAPDARRLSWVAWKNNYQSLGFYREQSECFLEEQIASGWERGHHFWGISVAFLLAVFVGLLAGGALVALMGYALTPAALGWVLAILALVVCLTPAVWVAVQERRGARHSGQGVQKAVLLVSDAVYGFGERPQRILANALGVVGLFALLYYITGLLGWGRVVWSGAPGRPMRPLECFYYSTVMFTTLGSEEIVPLGYYRILSSIESIIGVVLAALFIHAMARRTAGR